jgi:hypothetical protein
MRGDIVESEPPTQHALPVCRPLLRCRWTNRLTTGFRPLVNQFYATIHIRY